MIFILLLMFLFSSICYFSSVGYFLLLLLLFFVCCSYFLCYVRWYWLCWYIKLCHCFWLFHYVQVICHWSWWCCILIICVFVDYFSLLNDALTVLVSVNSVYGLKASINYVLLLCFLSSCFHVCSVNDA